MAWRGPFAIQGCPSNCPWSGYLISFVLRLALPSSSHIHIGIKVPIVFEDSYVESEVHGFYLTSFSDVNVYAQVLPCHPPPSFWCAWRCVQRWLDLPSSAFPLTLLQHSLSLLLVYIFLLRPGRGRRLCRLKGTSSGGWATTTFTFASATRPWLPSRATGFSLSANVRYSKRGCEYQARCFCIARGGEREGAPLKEGEKNIAGLG